MSQADIKFVTFKNLGSLLLLLVVTCIYIFIASQKYSPSHISLPVGADEFGYLNLAKAISEGRTFDNHVDRPFLPELLVYLEERNIAPHLYRSLIVPHAYHLFGDKVINQYPPGTSYFLSFLPIDSRQVLFPAIMIFLTIVPILLALLVTKKPDYNSGILFPIFTLATLCAFFLFFKPFSIEFGRVNSVAPTFGLLIAAGIVFSKYPVLALAIVASTTLFRIANILLLVPISLFYIFNNVSSLDLYRFTKRFLSVVTVILLSGVGVYLGYVYLLTGGPFNLTYGPADREFLRWDWLDGWKRLGRSINFYLNVKRPWFIGHIIVLSILGIFALRNNSGRKLFFMALFLAVFNYLFYLTHKVRVSYYPYGSMIIGVGFIVWLIRDSFSPRSLHVVSIMGLVVVEVYTAISLNFTSSIAKSRYNIETTTYSDTFAKYDVIWAELRSGTIEYAVNKPTFRYHWGDSTVRKEIIKWLNANGYTQAIWLDDHRMKAKEVLTDIDTIGIPYTIQDTPLGRVIKF